MENNKTYYEKLIEPFKYEDVNWRVSNAFSKDFTKKVAKAIIVPYLKTDVIQDRLDQVFGFDGWSNKFEKWGDNAQLCGISIKIGNEIITKYDGAPNSEFEEVKGGLSDSFKRAAKMLGIGRYLSKFDVIFLEVDLVGEKLNPSIRDIDLKTTLKTRYNKEISRIFSNTPTVTDSNENYLAIIQKLLKEKNINVKSVLERYKIKALSELNDEQAQKVIQILKSQKANIA